MRALAGATLTFAVTALACHQGLTVRGSATEIPQATRAVIHSSVACFAFTGIVVLIFYFLRPAPGGPGGLRRGGR